MRTAIQKQLMLQRELQDRRRAIRGRVRGDIEHVCPRCGSRDLTWALYKEKWRMYDLDMKNPHSCGEVATLDDFDIC